MDLPAARGRERRGQRVRPLVLLLEPTDQRGVRGVGELLARRERETRQLGEVDPLGQAGLIKTKK